MPHRPCNDALGRALAILILMFFATSLASPQTAITTYHVDNNRTGWNSHETVLTPANVGSSTFGLLQKVTLDGQVDAQPLFVPAVTVTAGNYQGVHDVVYVATENNTIYAIDAEAGTVLLSPNFGTAGSLPASCNSPKTRVGITATPVIDLTSNTLYVVNQWAQDPGDPYVSVVDAASGAVASPLGVSEKQQGSDPNNYPTTGFPTDAAWRPAWRSWVSAAPPSSPRRSRCG